MFIKRETCSRQLSGWQLDFKLHSKCRVYRKQTPCDIFVLYYVLDENKLELKLECCTFIHSLVCIRISSQWELSRDRIKPCIDICLSATALIRVSNARINAASARPTLVTGDHSWLDYYNLMWIRLFWWFDLISK